MMTEYQRIEEQDRKFRKLMRLVWWGMIVVLLLVCAVLLLVYTVLVALR